MKRFVRLLGSGIGAIALVATAGMGTASAGEDHKKDSYPEKKGWYYLDEKIVLNAGDTCSGKVVLKIKGHQRDLVNGKPMRDDYQPKKGDRLVAEAGRDQYVTVYNPHNHKKIRKNISGDFYDKVVDYDRDGKLDLKTKAVGKNVFFGNGVKGLIWANGKQYATLEDFMGESIVHIHKTKGKTVELCNKVGLKAVNGKNPALVGPPQT